MISGVVVRLGRDRSGLRRPRTAIACVQPHQQRKKAEAATSSPGRTAAIFTRRRPTDSEACDSHTNDSTSVQNLLSCSHVCCRRENGESPSKPTTRRLRVSPIRSDDERSGQREAQCADGRQADYPRRSRPSPREPHFITARQRRLLQFPHLPRAKLVPPDTGVGTGGTRSRTRWASCSRS